MRQRVLLNVVQLMRKVACIAVSVLLFTNTKTYLKPILLLVAKCVTLRSWITKKTRGDMRLVHLFCIFLMCFVSVAEAKPRKKSARAPSSARALNNVVYASIVIDAHTGKVLHNENADTITYPASLTKMMTLYLLFEAIETGKINPHHKFKVSVNATRQGPTKLYLKAGEFISVRDALLALMTKSANDVAVVVAEGLAGTEANFANRMTRKARALGMNNTSFANASGLPNPAQKTTARDMAALSLAIYKHYPRYYSYFKTKSFQYKGQNINNHNHLLGKVPGVDGIKTGFIFASGWNLSASAARSGQRVIAVVLGGKTRLWRDKRVAELIEVGFEKVNGGKNLVVPVPTHRPLPDFEAEEQQVAILKPKPAQPSMKPTVMSIKDATPLTGKWGIQVGAFSSSKKAQEVADSVQEQVSMLSSAKIVISPIKHTRGKLYQTRLVNLPENVARKACTQVVKNGHSCMPMRIKK